MVPVGPGPVVAGMTTRAIRLVGWIRPGQCLAVAGVTGRARRITAVIARIGTRAVPEYHGQPVAGAVAFVALQRSLEMHGRLAGRSCAVMAV